VAAVTSAHSLATLPIRRPVATTMLLVGVMVVGVVALGRLPLDFLPQVREPEVEVTIPFPGSHPLEVAREVLEPIEAELAAIPGVQEVRAKAREGQASVDVTFGWGARTDLRRLEVREAVERVKLPTGVGRARVRSRSTGIAGGAVLHGRISAERDLSSAYELLEKRLQRPLERVRGVASVDLYGVEAEEVRVDLDAWALKRHGIGADRVVGAISAANLDLDLGTLRHASGRVDLRFVGRLDALETLRRVPLAPGLVVGDVAQVERRSPRLSYGRHLDRRFAIGIDVHKEPGANTVETVARVRARMKELEADPALEGIRLLVWSDAGEEIRRSLGGLGEAGLTGGILAILVLLGFLRSARTTAIVAVAIPFSLLATTGAMYLLGASLDVLTLLGLMLGVGMLVDNAVVVIENIHRLQAEGVERREAAAQGVSGVSLAVVASTATTLIVWSWLFVTDPSPLTIYMGEVALAICLTVACSLLISLTFIPLAAARFATGRPKPPGPILSRLVPAYRALLAWSLEHRLIALTVLSLLAASAAYPISRIEKTGEPRIRQRAVAIGIQPHDPSSKEELERFVDQVEAWLEREREALGYETVYSWYDERGRTFSQVYLPRERATDRGIARLRAQLRERLPQIPGIKLDVSDRMWWRQSSGGDESRRVSLALHGDDPELLEELGRRVEAHLRQGRDVEEVTGPETSGRHEVRVRVRSEAARDLGLDPERVAQAVAFAFRGRRLGRYRGPEGERELVVALPREQRPGLSALRDLPIPRPPATSGEARGTIPLAAVADFERGRTPGTIERAQRRASLWLSVRFPKRLTGEEAKERVSERLEGFQLPAGYSWDYGTWGSRRDKSLTTMGRGVALSLLVVILLLVALFESVAQPLAIVVTIPFAFCGAFWALWGLDYELDAVGFIGVIILIGIVVNNGIVLVDQVNALRAEGLARSEALVQGCGQRLRPVLMTAITTLAGLIPLAASASTVAGAYIDSLAVAVIGGLATSTLFTLLALPAWYATVEDTFAFVRRLLPRLVESGEPVTTQ
jgi:hydrophobic/amphiphilic exporter-1 (mainly G- bacteria), HAE1 family